MELWYCGLRLGEALGLDTEHVHMDEGYVEVYGKGDKERIVPIGRMATEALRTDELSWEVTKEVSEGSGGKAWDRLLG